MDCASRGYLMVLLSKCTARNTGIIPDGNTDERARNKCSNVRSLAASSTTYVSLVRAPGSVSSPSPRSVLGSLPEPDE